MHESDPDVQRMLSFQAGDDSAFDGLFERWAAPLLRYLERMVGDTGTAEELLQEAFFRVHQARDRYAPKARFSTWLYRIATNLALNELGRPRRRHDHKPEDDHDLRSPGEAADRLLESRRMSALVERELARLPERQRMALWLSAVEGHSYAEVAQMIDASEKSVKALVHRARAALVGKLGAVAESLEAKGGASVGRHG